ncbi:V-type ATP synthase subunit C [bioreactor metagenome]|uniref:V-type ATP synthase subunit C n=1 Tax=bioreactor metagenome TaxID=1076179 RepID=A0A644YD38_9ZZZZ
MKTQTYFKECLQDINESQIHRGKLEMIIRQDLYSRFSRLIRYADAEDERSFFRYGILGAEVQQILLCARMIKNKDNVQMIAKLPMFYEKHIVFDLNRLASVKTLQDLLDTLQKTPYYDVVFPYISKSADEFDYTGLETALMSYYYQEILKLVEDNPKIRNSAAIHEIFETRIELDNLTKIYRMKRYFNAPPDQIIKILTPTYLKLPEKKLKSMALNLDAPGLIEELGKGPYGKYINPQNFVFMEYHTKVITYHMYKKNMEFAVDPDLIMLCYMALSETEIQNIVDIIEGVRYKVPVDRISSLLIR